MSVPPSLPPAGWFPDPEDAAQQRYWDGQQWTEHRAPATAPSAEAATTAQPEADPTPNEQGEAAETTQPLAAAGVAAASASQTAPTPPPAPPGAEAPAAVPGNAKPGKPLWRRWWVITAAAVVVLIVIIAATSSGGSKKPASDSAGSKASASHAASSAPPTTTTAPSPTTTAPPAKPAPVYRTFGDGTFQVNKDIKPGTYRTRSGSDGCYWERMKNFSGDLNSIIDNDNTNDPAVVTILKTDKGFTSQDCGTWTTNLTQITKSKTAFGPGTMIVHVDLVPGTYKSTAGADGCYWERMKSFHGGINSIIANDNTTHPAVVTIRSTDVGFQSSDCGNWHKIG